MLKVILVLLLIAMLASLTGALKSLFKNAGKPDQTATYKWLAIRVSIAFAIIIVIAIGFFTGELSIGAPWSGQY